MTPELPPGSSERLDALLELLQSDPQAPVSIRSIAKARQVHVADSLSGLELVELTSAERIADLGSGAGFPGLVLAIALPASRVDLIESVSRKCAFLERAIDRTGAANATVICERAESWAGGAGREAYRAVTARAIGRLPTIAELASPLLATGGHLAAWRGRRDPEEEDRLARAGMRLAMEPVAVRPVFPYPGSRDRHIHLLRKNGPTPKGLPRRIGLAAKRPFGTE